jgi:hypothetical protein
MDRRTGHGLTAALDADAWGTAEYLDRIEELLDMGDWATVDAALAEAAEALGTIHSAAVEGQVDIGRCGTRGWLGSVLQGAIPEEEIT